MKSIYNYTDYRKYLNDLFETDDYKHGAKQKLADAINCKNSQVSNILSGRSHLSIEQVLPVASFISLNKLETDFFMLLVLYARAGSKDLEKYYENKLSVIVNEQKKIISRVIHNNEYKKITKEQLIKYYMYWFTPVIHMCLRNSSMQTISGIEKTLRISTNDVEKAISILLELDLVKLDSGRFLPSDQRFHFDKDDYLIKSYHLNCRHLAIRSMDEKKDSELHYSLIMSIDLESFKKIQEIVLAAIEKVDQEVLKASDQLVYGLCLDLFQISS